MPKKKIVVAMSGGASSPFITIVDDNGKECKPQVEDIPQPYGSPGRLGSIMGAVNNILVVCGGLDSSGPPISSFKDCQRLNLDTRYFLP